jgi:excisionase family DNA binding protein
MDKPLLRPREVAEMFGVRPTTIARWAREGKLSPLFTPGGHRRYSYADVHKILSLTKPTPEDALVADAMRLYNQGWSIRQVAERFGYSYGAMRRLLRANTTLRHRGGASINPYPIDKED